MHLRIFWPDGAGAEDASGYVVGWRIGEHLVCVVAVVCGKKLHDLSRRIATVDKRTRREHGVGGLAVLGEFDGKVGSVERDAAVDAEFPGVENTVPDAALLGDWRRRSEFWLQCAADEADGVRVRGLLCSGFSEPVAGQMFFFSPPKGFDHFHHHLYDKGGHMQSPHNRAGHRELLTDAFSAMRARSTSLTDDDSSRESLLERCIYRVNLTTYVQQCFLYTSTGEYGPGRAWSRCVLWSLSLFETVGLLCLAVASLFRRYRPWLMTISRAAAQVDLRCRLIVSLPAHTLAVLRARRGSRRVVKSRNRVLSSLLIIGLDLWLGYALATALRAADRARVGDESLIDSFYIDAVTKLQSVFESHIAWLMGSPAGFKLNAELARLFGLVSMTVGDVLFATVLAPPCVSFMYHAIRYSGYAGASVLLATLHDLVVCVCLSGYVLHIIFSSLFALELAGLQSLLCVFRGLKYNVLRRRIDTCAFSLPQFFVGTLLFTIFVYLFMTIAAYYVFFVVARACVLCAFAVMDALVVLVNHFPLWALVSRVCEPHAHAESIAQVMQSHWQSAVHETVFLVGEHGRILERQNSVLSTTRFPNVRGGTVAEFTGEQSSAALQERPPSRFTHYRLSSYPLPLASAFDEVRSYTSALRDHYSPIMVLRALLKGDLVPRRAGSISAMVMGVDGDLPTFAAFRETIASIRRSCADVATWQRDAPGLAQ